MGSPEDAKNVTLLRVLTEMQALLAAQRRIEWKLTGIEKAQLSVNDTLNSFRQEIVEVRGRMDTLRQDSQPQSHQFQSHSRDQSPDTSPASKSARARVIVPEEEPESRVPSREIVPSRSSPSSRSVKTSATHQEEILRVFRNDGRILTQLGRWKKAKTNTACKLPCAEVKGGESLGQAVDRLVRGRLGVLARGILLTGESEEVIPTTKSRRFSITNAMASVTTPTTPKKSQMIFEGLMDPSFRIPSVCVASTAGNFRPKGRGLSVPKEDILAIWWEGDIFLYSWLTSEELEYFASDGDAQLSQWIATSVVNEQSLQKVVSI